MDDIYQRMFDANVRLEVSWPFPVSPASDALLEALEENEDNLPAPIAALMARWSDDERDMLFGGGMEAGNAFSELCCEAFNANVSGWIGRAAVPVFNPHRDGKGASFSWGHYHVGLLFASSADGLLAAAIEWAEASHARDMARAAA